MSKKILFLVGNMNNSGGTERVCSIIANELDKVGYHVSIISISEGDNPFFELSSNIKISSLFTTTGRSLYRTPNTIYRLRKLLKTQDYDTLIVVESMLVLFTLPAVQGLSINHVCWEHFNFNEDLGKKSRRLARQLAARYCDIVVTLTDKDKQKWLNSTKHQAQIISIPNPSPYPPQKSIRKFTTNTVLAVGRLTYQKGFDLLLQAWKSVSRQMPEWKLIIVGEGEDRTQLESFIEENDLNSSVSLVGNTNNIDEYYRKAEILCLSSRFEGFPMVLLETLSYGIPVVAFDCDTGPSEILQSTGGILVPQEDTNKLADSLIEVMSNKNIRKKISSKSLIKSNIYQPNNIINRWIEIV